ncbi:MAG: membrane protein insertase YidC [Candidatus Caenarcaniphilales bacterium]|nr:membrane protein insertase YidC [Candidatus Caenarcaniphilales bacterium]
MDFNFLTYTVMLPLLEFFRHALGNYGWAIILVTILVKALLFPVSIKQSLSAQKSQAQMAKIKPELDHLQEKFKLRRKKYESDPAKLEEVQREFQEQMMDLYKKSGAMNPLGGCLLALLQLPILIAMYWAFSGPPFQDSILHIGTEATLQASTKNLDEKKKLNSDLINFVDPEGRLGRLRLISDIPEKLLVGDTYKLELVREQGKGEIPTNLIKWHLLGQGQNPSQIPTTEHPNAWSEGILDLTVDPQNPTKATLIAHKPADKFNIQAIVPVSRGHQSFLFVKDLGQMGIMPPQKDGFSLDSLKEIRWDICILIALMGVSFWFSNKIMMQSTPQPPSLDETQQEVQKQMQQIMPVTFLVMMIFLPIPAGVYIYFIVSNLLQIAQSYLTQRFIPKSETPVEPHKLIEIGR